MPEDGTTTARVRQIIPVVGVRNVPLTLAFYTDRLGFKEQYVAGEPPRYAVVSRDGQIIHFSHSDIPTSGCPAGLYVWIDNLDSFYAECQNAGMDFKNPPATQPYGMREFSLNDPNGIRITFAEEAD